MSLESLGQKVVKIIYVFRFMWPNSLEKLHHIY